MYMYMYIYYVYITHIHTRTHARTHTHTHIPHTWSKGRGAEGKDSCCFQQCPYAAM